MANPDQSGEQVTVSMETVIEALRNRVNDLTWENVLLNARLSQSEEMIKDLMGSKEASPPSAA